MENWRFEDRNPPVPTEPLPVKRSHARPHPKPIPPSPQPILPEPVVSVAIVDTPPHHPLQVMLLVAKQLSTDGVMVGVHIRGPERCDREPRMAYALGAVGEDKDGTRASWSPVELLQVFHALERPFPCDIFYREVARTAITPEGLHALLLMLLTKSEMPPCKTLQAVREAVR